MIFAATATATAATTLAAAAAAAAAAACTSLLLLQQTSARDAHAAPDSLGFAQFCSLWPEICPSTPISPIRKQSLATVLSGKCGTGI
ncbi:unnamed protein product [Gongylonema pulchrum]|uniref:Secreted protein n=1 Tax=Gongylonema pulchrum TaxID=637853 RepID=A0A183ED93_9BILA|nr:unnamed protein product [Gongylonema pulchrum]